MEKEEERARREFTSEAEELLESFAVDLAELDEKRGTVSPAIINDIFRAIHSLKGLAGMLGFTGLATLTHQLEDLLDRLRLGKVQVSSELLALLLDCHAELIRMVSAASSGAETGERREILERIERAAAGDPTGKKADLLAGLDLDAQTRKSLTEYEEYRLQENVRIGRSIFSLTVQYDFLDFDEKLRALTARLNAEGEVISTLPTAAGAGIGFRLLVGALLSGKELVALSPEAQVRLLQSAPEPRSPDGEEGLASIRSLSQNVRVDISRLDNVMDVVGELILEKARLDELIAVSGSSLDRRTARELGRISGDLERRLNQLRRAIVDLRMVPISQLYTRVGRAARKAAEELGKEIELLTAGGETELDKVMIEELADPLMHVVRNAIDHGIETSEKRVAAGKPVKGEVRIRAYQQGSFVIIDISDDGEGIDVESVRRSAVRSNLIGQDEVVDFERARELIFSPGLSTSEAVSEVSGRGVGLDVVRKNIHELKGSIEVLSDRGSGTTIRLTLPITLAILHALLVRVGNETFALPLTSISEVVKIQEKEITTVEGREILALRDAEIPLLRLSDAYGVEASSQNGRKFVAVVRLGDRLAGLVLDEVVRQQEVVIRAVGNRIRGIPGIAGATEIGKNQIALVVDVASLVSGLAEARTARRESRTAVSRR
ncbi:MAG: chemotaxis protein CheA [Acidobacteriota bacterium]